jgi:CrcB protein
MAGASVRSATATLLAVSPGHWPVATFIVNLAGAFILGALLEALSNDRPGDRWRPRLRLLAGTGFCGALTTYSTLAVEVDMLIRSHYPALAAAYAIVSVIAGLVTTAAGIWAATLWRRR